MQLLLESHLKSDLLENVLIFHESIVFQINLECLDWLRKETTSKKLWFFFSTWIYLVGSMK